MKISMVVSTQQTKFEAVSFKGDLAVNLENIAKLGYNGAELAIRDPKLVNGDALIQLLRQFNLEIPAIGTGQAWGEEGLSYTDPDIKVRESAIERTLSHIPFAKQTGAIIIIGLIRGTPKNGISQSDAAQLMLEAFCYCTQEAAKEDVRIAFEPINRYETTLLNSAKDGMDFIEKVASDQLGLLLDTFHMNIEEPNIEQSIAMCDDRIFHFHVADSNRMYPGAGHLNFPSILESLYSTGYSGYISGEHKSDPDAMTSAKLGIEYLRSLGSFC
jgi:5-keto-L-gluconate epimerase